MPLTTPNNTAPSGIVHRPCHVCGDTIDPRRAALGKYTCIDCQIDLDRLHPVRHTIVPLNKSNYIAVRDLSMLAQLNPKRTT